VGGTASKRASLRKIVRGFGRSDLLEVQIRLDSDPPPCSDALDFSTRKESQGSDRGWWEPQVVAGAFMRLRGRPICSLSVREGRSGAYEGGGLGVGELPRASPTSDEVRRAVRAAAGSAHLRLVTIVDHRPVRLTPEIILLARDPHAFERRMDTFQRAFFPTMRRLDAFYVEVRSACGNPVWLVAGSTATGAGGTWADRHWICPFGDLLNQHCPKERATTNNPCI